MATKHKADWARMTQDGWDASYRSARWDYLSGVGEVARYAVIAGFVRALGRGGAVLDIGCGEGILHAYLHPGDTLRYLGIEWSKAAIAAARSRYPGIPLVHADLRSAGCLAGRTFAAIVFNEVLYYCDSPSDVLEQYAKALDSGGVVIVSMCDQPGTSGLAGRVADTWRYLGGPGWEMVDGVSITNARRTLSWQVRALRLATDS